MSNVKITELTPDPNNANKGTQRGLKALDKSLRQYGAGRSILLDRDNRIIAGNKTAERALDVGLDDVIIVETDGTKLVAVKRTDLDLEDDGGKARALATYDNRVGQLDLEWDLDALGAIDADVLGDLWSDKELADLGVNLGEPPDDPGAQIDKADELRQKWGVETGQLWKLGEHRLICGDCTDRGVVDAVMMGEKATLLMADPPYNVKYTGGSTNDVERPDSYEDDMSDEDYTSWLLALLKNGFDCTDDKSALMLWFASAKMRCIMDGFEGSGWSARTLIVWNKTKAHYGALGAQYKHKYEPMWYCFKTGHAPRFYGATNETTVWDFDQPRVNDLHPTMKPVELYERCVGNHSEKGGEVLELFSGSGTTLIACERLGRKCRAVEISPGYVAVAIQRWVDMTGGTPELLHT